MTALPKGRPRIPALCEVGDWTWKESLTAEEPIADPTAEDAGWWILFIDTIRRSEFQRVDYVQNGINYVAYLRVK